MADHEDLTDEADTEQSDLATIKADVDAIKADVETLKAAAPVVPGSPDDDTSIVSRLARLEARVFTPAELSPPADQPAQ